MKNIFGTKLAKISNNLFEGFYDKEIHESTVFEIGKNGEKELKSEYIEISDDLWSTLLEGSSQGKKIRFAPEKNELGLYEIPPEPKYLVKPEYNYENHEWIEKATFNQQVEHYKNLIIQKTGEIEMEKLAGFGNPSLELELNELKKIHLEKSHELGLQIENRLKEV